jgi:hypothetical protein
VHKLTSKGDLKMEIRKVKSVPKIRRASEFDPTIEDVAGRIMKDPTSTWEVVDVAAGLVSRFRARKKAGEFAGVSVTPRAKSAYFTAVEG